MKCFQTIYQYRFWIWKLVPNLISCLTRHSWKCLHIHILILCIYALYYGLSHCYSRGDIFELVLFLFNLFLFLFPVFELLFPNFYLSFGFPPLLQYLSPIRENPLSFALIIYFLTIQTMSMFNSPGEQPLEVSLDGENESIMVPVGHNIAFQGFRLY